MEIVTDGYLNVPINVMPMQLLPNEIIECSTLDEFLYHLNFCDYAWLPAGPNT